MAAELEEKTMQHWVKRIRDAFEADPGASSITLSVEKRDEEWVWLVLRHRLEDCEGFEVKSGGPECQAPASVMTVTFSAKRPNK